MSTSGGPRATSRFERLRAATDRVPTKWFAAIGSGVFLAVTAGFGGLAAVEEQATPELSPGDVHESAQLSIRVDRAVLIDELPDAGVYPEDGERVLAVVLTAENRWTEPLWTGGEASVGSAVRLAVDPDRVPERVARYDDATLDPWLQPGVPAELVLTWTVPAGVWADGDELVLDLRDQSLYTGSFVTSGEYWVDPTLAATVALVLDDVGAGAEATDG